MIESKTIDAPRSAYNRPEPVYERDLIDVMRGSRAPQTRDIVENRYQNTEIATFPRVRDPLEK
jgi:hypothetical protein